KATVLPDPVLEETIRSRPCACSATTAAWTGVSSVYPRSSNARARAGCSWGCGMGAPYSPVADADSPWLAARAWTPARDPLSAVIASSRAAPRGATSDPSHADGRQGTPHHRLGRRNEAERVRARELVRHFRSHESDKCRRQGDLQFAK